MKLYVRVATKQEQKTLLTILVGLGYTSQLSSDFKYRTTANVDEIIVDTPLSCFSDIVIDIANKDICFDNLFAVEYCWSKDSAEVLELITTGPTVVKLNESYSATITNDGVSVGCQTFSFEVIDELVAEIAKFREQ